MGKDVDLSQVTAVVLCGGQGERMGGLDKPLLRWRGIALVDHVIGRLPDTLGGVMISANRNLTEYRTRAPVISDAGGSAPIAALAVEDAFVAEPSGPLAGIAAALRVVKTPWLLVVPGDTPRVPLDLAERLGGASSLPVVRVAHDGVREQHLHMLVHKSHETSLRTFVDAGGHRVWKWLRENQALVVPAGCAEDFINFNLPEDLCSV